jgi:hypothetical protein
MPTKGWARQSQSGAASQQYGSADSWAMTQRAAASTAVMATDIASAIAMSLTHSSIFKARFQSAPLPHCTVHEPETPR